MTFAAPSKEAGTPIVSGAPEPLRSVRAAPQSTVSSRISALNESVTSIGRENLQVA
jgi:hypothetical protein